MPLVDDVPLNEMFDPARPLIPKADPTPPPSFLDVMGAAGRTENDIVAAIDLMSTPKPKVDMNFDLIGEAKKRNVAPEDFTDAVNASHLDELIRKRDQEVKDNAVLDESGWLGFAARMAAGIVSPTTLLPMVGPEAKGLQMMAKVGVNAAAGAAIQEGVLYADQRTRTKTQAAYSIGSSLILGSVLGAVSHTLSKSVVDKIAHDMDHTPNGFTISGPTPSVGDAGAKEAGHLQDAGKLKKGWGADKLAFLSPITRGFQQWNAPAYLKEMGGSSQLRKMTAGFSQGSLSLEENKRLIAASPGGNVEDLKRTYAAVSYAGSKILEKNYVEYILGTNPGGLFKKQRAILSGAQRPDGKLSYMEFKRQIALDMWSNFSREGVPDMVRKAAKEIDQQVYKKLYDEGVEVGIFTGKEKTVGDENYANRVYNNEVIMRRHNEFVKILADHYRESLDKEFNAKLVKLNEAMQKDKQLFEDANLPFEKVQALRDDLINAGVDLTDATNPAVIKGVEAIKANTKAIRELTAELDNLKKVKVEGSDLEGLKARKDRMGEIEAALKAKALENEGTRKALGTELEKYQQAAAEIRRRLNNLNKNINVQDVKMGKKLDKIAKNEDAQVATILRAQKQLQKFVKMLESATDDKLDAELGKLKTAFAEAGKKFDKLEEDYTKLANDFEGKNDPPVPPGGDGTDGNNPPKAGPGGETPPVVEPPKLTAAMEARVRDIVVSNIEGAIDGHVDMQGIDNALREYEKNIYDTIADEFKKGTPEYDLAVVKAAELINTEVARFSKKIDEIRKGEDWVKPIPELRNVSKRDMDDAGLLPDQIEEVLKAPGKFRDMMELINRGYKLIDGVFRQVTQEDADKALKAYDDFDYHARHEAIREEWKNNAPSDRLPDADGKLRTRGQAFAALDAEQDMLRLNSERFNRALDKADRFPDTIYGPKIDAPVRPPLTGDPLTHKLNENFSIASEYWRTVQDATDWLEKYGSKYERVLAQRIKSEIGFAEYYSVNPFADAKVPGNKALRDALGPNSNGKFVRNIYYPHPTDNAGVRLGDHRKMQAMVLMKKGTGRGTLVHELLHAATASRVDLGKHFPHKYPELAKIYNELEALRKHAKYIIDVDVKAGKDLNYYIKYAVKDVHELIANVLSTPRVADYFKSLPPHPKLGAGKNLYGQFVTLIRRILGIPAGEHNAFTQVLELSDKLMKEKRGYFEAQPLGIKRTADHRIPLEDTAGWITNPQEIPGKAEANELNDNFKKWFEGSTVVNEDGSPKVMYHGTSKDQDFKSFKASKRGMFFTEDRTSASDYAVENDSKKVKMGPGWTFEHVNTSSRVMPVYLSIKKPYKLSEAELKAYAEDPRPYAKVQAEIADRAKAAGYDGVDYGGGVMVAFEPTQIKSAIGNNGDFNPRIPDTTRQLGEDPAIKIEDKMGRLAGKMDELAGKIEKLDSHDRAKWRAEVEDMMKELADTHAKINAKRAVRNEKLWKQVEALGPEARAKRMAALQLKMKERPQKFLSRWNVKNAGDMRMNDNGLLEGKGDFQAHAEEMARETVGKILGIDRRLAYSDIIKEKRGPELARLLNIPSEKIKDFLETDIERMLAIYTRTVGSDISVARVFGSPDAAEDFAKLTDEQQNMLAKIETMTGKDGKPLSQAEKEKLQYETNKFYTDARKDLMVLLERAKGTRGIPRDAASWSARGAKMAMDLNFMRLMGNVVISSVADPARLVMKYGLTRTFRDAFMPMITNLKTIRMSQHEALLAGSGLDPVLHSRAYSMFDIFDDAHRGTPIEKGVHWASTKMGLMAGFDWWTSGIKQVTAGAANAKLLDNIAAIMEGKVKGKELLKAQEFLARNNLDADLVERIWKEVTNGEGGGKVNGIWLPNTEAWTDAGAKRAYRAALGGEIDSTIITPGFERPNWVDSSIPARMIAQFKSFGMTSTQKTLMAGLQEHDLAFFNGVMSSLALGALSYYLYGVASGGKTYTEMMNAGPDKWADEAISRSGVTGIFDEVQRIANRVPLLQKYASFSGKQTTRRGGGDLVSETLGPSFDLLQRAYKIGTEIDQPTKSTLHTVRTLLPLQNVFYLRQLLDKVEQFAGSGLPEKRSAK